MNIQTITTSTTSPNFWALMNFAGCVFVDSKFYPATMETVSEWQLPDLAPPTCDWCNRQINTDSESIDEFGWCANCYADDPDLVNCPRCDGTGEVEERYYPYNGSVPHPYYMSSTIREVECETCQGTTQITNDEYLRIKAEDLAQRERFNHWLS